jgi:rhodanese-related sulfurtransferase
LRIIIIDREDSPYGRVLTDHLKKEGLSAKYLEGGIVNYSNNDYPLINTGNPTQPTDLMKVTSINTDQLLEMVFDGTRIVLVDTRPAEAFATGNIRGSINIPLEEVEQRKNDFPTKTIVLYDENTMRSFRAAVRLYDLGFFEVYNCLDDYQTLNRRLIEELEKNKKQPPPPDSL